jgi:hypothetical protein
MMRDGMPLFDGDESKFVMWRNDFKAFAMIKKFRGVLDRVDRERSKVDQDGSSEASSGSDSGSSGSSGSSVDGKTDEGKKNEKTKKMKKMNVLAYSYLLRALTGQPKMMVTLNAEDDGAKAWKLLRKHYEGKDLLRVNNLKTKLLTKKLAEGGDPMAFMLEMEELACQINQAEADQMPERQLVSLIMRGLPRSYEDFTTILSLDSGKLTLSKLRSKLRAFDDNRKFKQLEDMTGNWSVAGTGAGAYAVTGAPQRPAVPAQSRGTPARAPLTCHRCHQPGHIARECPQPVVCYVCGGAHSAARCDKRFGGPNGPGPRKGQPPRASRPAAANVATAQDSSGGGVAFMVDSNIDVSDLDSGDWLVDTGCSAHMCGNRDAFVNFGPSLVKKVKVANNSEMDVLGEGSVKVQVFGAWNKRVTVTLLKVLFVPDVTQNLLSVGAMTRNGAVVDFGASRGRVVTSAGEILLDRRGNLFIMRGELVQTLQVAAAVTSIVAEASMATTTSGVKLANLMHRRLGHASVDAVLKLPAVTTGLEELGNVKLADCECGKCDTCLRAKFTRFPFPSRSTRAGSKLERVFIDVHGPQKVPGILGGERYTIGFTDDYSGLGVVFNTVNKNEVLTCFKKFIVAVGGRPKKLRVDNGGEFINGEFLTFCADREILVERTMPYSAEENGRQERQWYTLDNMVRAMLIEAGLDDRKEFWPFAMSVANYNKNRVPSRVIGFETPLGKFHGSKPNIGNLRVFGCAAWVLIEKEKRRSGKLSDRAFLGVFVGYDTSSKGYLVFNPKTLTVIRSRNVVFDESVKGGDVLSGAFPGTNSSVPLRFAGVDDGDADSVGDDDSSDSSPAQVVEPVAALPEQVGDLIQFDDVPAAAVDNDIAPTVDNTPKSRYGRPLRKTSEHPHYVVANSAVIANTVPIPRTVKEAMLWDVNNWSGAIKSEFEAQLKMDSWQVVSRATLPRDCNVVGSRFVFDVKMNPDGTVERYKARLVAQGFSQVEGVDFAETYAPVLKMTTLRCALAIAAHHHYFVDQLDVNTAFLNSQLKETVYMKVPAGYSEFVDADVTPSTHVLQLNKSIYGLKQAGRDWYETLHATMIALGFTRAKKDKCVYRKMTAAGYFVCLVYVDDLITIAEFESDRDEFVAAFREKFKTKEMKPLDLFLGMNVKYDRLAGNLVLSQENYVASMLKSFGMESSNATYTPAEINKLSKDDLPLLDSVLHKEYESMVGSILYASTCTRPDVSYAVSRCGSFTSAPAEPHRIAAKRILRYMKGTPCDGIGFAAGSKFGLELIGFADADWAGDGDTCRSRGGYVFLLAGGSVTWHSKLQATVARSSTEAEFVSLADAVSEAKHLRQLLGELGCVQAGPTKIYEDNQGCVFMSKNDLFSRRVKHIDVGYYFVQESVNQFKDVDVIKIDTNANPADCLTKPLAKEKLDDFRTLLMHVESAK